jgi:hypothetical protein
MMRNTKNLQDEQHKSWGSDDLMAAVDEAKPGRPEQIVARIAEETAEKFRAIFAVRNRT